MLKSSVATTVIFSSTSVMYDSACDDPEFTWCFELSDVIITPPDGPFEEDEPLLCLQNGGSFANA